MALVVQKHKQCIPVFFTAHTPCSRLPEDVYIDIYTLTRIFQHLRQNPPPHSPLPFQRHAHLLHPGADSPLFFCSTDERWGWLKQRGHNGACAVSRSVYAVSIDSIYLGLHNPPVLSVSISLNLKQNGACHNFLLLVTVKVSVDVLDLLLYTQVCTGFWFISLVINKSASGLDSAWCIFW